MTGVIFIFMTPVIFVNYLRDYNKLSLSIILNITGARKSMKLFRPRWRKVLRDLAINKTRAALVVLSLAVGIFTVSFLIDAESLLRIAFDREFAAVSPSSATILIPGRFNQDFVEVIRKMPEIQEVEGRRSVNARLKAGTNQWVNLNISAIDDFDKLSIDKVKAYSGAWPPAKNEILLERSSLRMAVMPDLNTGDMLTIQTAGGENITLKLVGVSYDFNRTPSAGTGVAYGYVTLDTLARLGEPSEFNDLRFIVAQDKLDKGHILQVADLVKEKVEKSGQSVGVISVPEPGQHPLGTVLNSLIIILGALSLLTLFSGALLVFNTIVSLLAQQVRQIGIMKSIGAGQTQIVAMYLAMVLIFGVLALAITTPLAIQAGTRAADFLANFFNLNLGTTQIPALAFVVEALIGLGVPFLAALYPIWSGTRVTVREALADYGLARKETAGVLDRFFKMLRGPLFRRPVLLSLRNTFRRRSRLVLTLLPLAISGAILLTVVNVRAGLMSELDNIFSYRKYDVNVSFDDMVRLEKIKNVIANVSGIINTEGYRETRDAYRLFADGSRSNNLSVLALEPETKTVELPLTAGRWLLPQDQEAVVVNSALLRDQPDIHLGDQLSFKINGRKLTLQVIGIVNEKMAPAGMYMSAAFFAKKLGDVGRVSNLWVQTVAKMSPEVVKKDLEAQFEQADISVASLKTASDERGFVEFHFSIMVIPLGLAALILALVGGLGLTSTMTTNVMERSREVGVMRAVGASDGSIQQIFMVEGLFIGLLSWLISVAASFPFTYALNNMVGNRFLYTPLTFSFSIGGALIWLIVVILTVVLSCYVPAQDASQTSVRELLAYE
jgi:putative ABC transport system permease protein